MFASKKKNLRYDWNYFSIKFYSFLEANFINNKKSNTWIGVFIPSFCGFSEPEFQYRCERRTGCQRRINYPIWILLHFTWAYARNSSVPSKWCGSGSKRIQPPRSRSESSLRKEKMIETLNNFLCEKSWNDNINIESWRNK